MRGQKCALPIRDKRDKGAQRFPFLEPAYIRGMTDTNTSPIPGFAAGRTLLIIDDDQRFADRLGVAMERRGYEVTVAHSVEEGRRLGLARAARLRHH